MNIRYRPTTFVTALFCFVALVCAYTGVTLLSESGPIPSQIACASPPPGPNWLCVNGGWIPDPNAPPPPPPSPPPPPTLQMISAGEEVTGTVSTLASEMLFELTVPSDGTLIVELSGADLILEGVYRQPMWRPRRIYSTVATLPVTAGQTYHLSVSAGFGFYYYFYEEATFVLKTSLVPGTVTAPPACETDPPPGDWVCIVPGWVPAGHPLDPGTAPPPSGTPPPPAPPPPSQCATPDPFVSLGGGTCCSGGWRPPGMACDGAPPPPPPPPPGPSTCTTPDPFVSLGGGTCCPGGGWRPPGMACG